MTGFEWQAAAHMIWEGHDQPDLLEKGLAISRAIHDRYDGRQRNPYNEIECSDHYARSMASYGVFQAVCGFNCHGPSGTIEFAPRLSPEDFKAPFTTAQGWGTFTQERTPGEQTECFEIKWGSLDLKTLTFALPQGKTPNDVRVTCEGRVLQASTRLTGNQLAITLSQELCVQSGQSLDIKIGLREQGHV